MRVVGWVILAIVGAGVLGSGLGLVHGSGHALSDPGHDMARLALPRPLEVWCDASGLFLAGAITTGFGALLLTVAVLTRPREVPAGRRLAMVAVMLAIAAGFAALFAALVRSPSWNSDPRTETYVAARAAMQDFVFRDMAYRRVGNRIEYYQSRSYKVIDWDVRQDEIWFHIRINSNLQTYEPVRPGEGPVGMVEQARTVEVVVVLVPEPQTGGWRVARCEAPGE